MTVTPRDPTRHQRSGSRRQFSAKPNWIQLLGMLFKCLPATHVSQHAVPGNTCHKHAAHEPISHPDTKGSTHVCNQLVTAGSCQLIIMTEPPNSTVPGCHKQQYAGSVLTLTHGGTPHSRQQ